jgi:hypothetical protein
MARKKNAGAKHFGKPLTDDPDDAPELLSDFFRHGELRHGDRLPSRPAAVIRHAKNRDYAPTR